MSGLTFDEATHTYRFNGVIVPGVTTILKPLSSLGSVPKRILDAASAFGTAVHKACELWDLGDLDEESLDPSLVPYLNGWKKFSAEHDVKWLKEGIESPVYHATHGYAGTLDRYGNVDGELAVVDIKSSTKLYATVGPQLAAYKAALGGRPSTKRFAVQLKPDGSYVLKEYADRDDLSVFLSILTLNNWSARHGITPNFSKE